MIFRTLHLAQPGLTAGWQAGWPADKIYVIFKFNVAKSNNQLLALFTKRTALLQLYQCVKLVFWLKPIVRWVSRHAKMLHSMHSLSIPTIKYYRTVLNDESTEAGINYL